MITKNIGSTIVTVCENTARCTVYQPTDIYFNQILEYIGINNYVCAGVYSTKDIAERFVYYSGGTLFKNEDELKDMELTFD
jgi:hypothetical protein